MKTYYYNGAQILAPFTITSNEPMFDMTTISLKTQRASQGAQRWELSFDIIAENSNQADLFVSSFKDIESANTMIMPQLTSSTKPRYNSSGEDTLYKTEEVGANLNEITMPISVSASAGATQVYIGAGTAVVTGLMPKGTFIKFSNSDKLYVTTSDANFANSGSAIDIYPRLKKTLSTSDNIVLKDLVQFSYYRDIGNQQGITFTDGILSNIGQINLIEAV